MRFSLPSIKSSAAPPNFQLLPSGGNQIVEGSSDNKIVLSGRQKLGGAAEHLIDCSTTHIYHLSYEFETLCIIERHSKAL